MYENDLLLYGEVLTVYRVVYYKTVTSDHLR